MATAGTITNTAVKKIVVGARVLFEYLFDWQVKAAVGSSTSGMVQLNIATVLVARHPNWVKTDAFGGFLQSVETIPGASGDLTTNCATAINITLKDPYGYDVMATTLLTRSSSLAQKAILDPPILLNTELELNVGTTWTTTNLSQGRLIMVVEQ